MCIIVWWRQSSLLFPRQNRTVAAKKDIRMSTEYYGQMKTQVTRLYVMMKNNTLRWPDQISRRQNQLRIWKPAAHFSLTTLSNGKKTNWTTQKEMKLYEKSHACFHVTAVQLIKSDIVTAELIKLDIKFSDYN